MSIRSLNKYGNRPITAGQFIPQRTERAPPSLWPGAAQHDRPARSSDSDDYKMVTLVNGNLAHWATETGGRVWTIDIDAGAIETCKRY